MERSDRRTAGEIRFAVHESTLGRVLVAESDRGVCAVLLGEEDGALRQELESRFPAARITEGGVDLAARVVDLVEQPSHQANLPLDARGTTFQQAVWQALRQIPAGRTASYAEIARKLGRPRAVRAVGQACAANRVAVLIPCHRAVRSDGHLAGYRWGIERKRALLEREAAA